MKSIMKEDCPLLAEHWQRRQELFVCVRGKAMEYFELATAIAEETCSPCYCSKKARQAVELRELPVTWFEAVTWLQYFEFHLQIVERCARSTLQVLFLRGAVDRASQVEDQLGQLRAEINSLYTLGADMERDFTKQMQAIIASG